MSAPRMLRVVWSGPAKEDEQRDLAVECPRTAQRVRIERCLRCGFSPGITIAGPSEVYVRCFGREDFDRPDEDD